MNRQLMREYRAFRGTGCLVGHDARVALENARTVLLWERLESAGLVRLEVLPDEHFDWSDLSDEDRERHGNDGAWGTVGQFQSGLTSTW